MSTKLDETREITWFIHELVREFVEDPKNRVENAWDINTGLCEEFALRLENRFPDGTPRWFDELHINDPRFQPEGFQDWNPSKQEEWCQENHDVPSHCVFQFKNRFYDSQDTNGVEDWTTMQVYQRKTREEFLKETKSPGVSGPTTTKKKKNPKNQGMTIRRQQEILDEILQSKNPKAVISVLTTCCFDELKKRGEPEELRRLGHTAIRKARKLRKEQSTTKRGKSEGKPGKIRGKSPKSQKKKARSQTSGATSGV